MENNINNKINSSSSNNAAAFATASNTTNNRLYLSNQQHQQQKQGIKKRPMMTRTNNNNNNFLNEYYLGNNENKQTNSWQVGSTTSTNNNSWGNYHRQHHQLVVPEPQPQRQHQNYYHSNPYNANHHPSGINDNNNILAPQDEQQQQQQRSVRTFTSSSGSNTTMIHNPYLRSNNNNNNKGSTSNLSNQNNYPHNAGSSSSSSSAVLPQSFVTALKYNLSQKLQLTVKLDENDETTSSLNKEQRLVIESIMSGYNVFFTGPAGSGKSHILNTLANVIDNKKKKIVITATTGIAACSIGGVTIHSFAGCGVGLQSSSGGKTFEQQMQDICGRVMGNANTIKRWRETNILIIDEISMMSSGFLDMLNIIAKRTRNNRRPFGGLQIVLCGDFFQLPPVDKSKKSNGVSPPLRRGQRNINGFAFESQCWCEIIQKTVLLKQVFRQNGDVAFMNILNEARIGELSYNSITTLKRHSLLPPAARRNGNGDDNKEEGNSTKINATKLECRNVQVDKANDIEMKRLPKSAEERTYVAKDMALHRGYDAILRQCAAPELLKVKVGAQVILLKNIDPAKGLVNGSRGVVIGYSKPKSSKNSDLPREYRTKEYPVVRFESSFATTAESSDNHNYIDIIATPEEWTNKMSDVIVCARIQVPLRLAWALSVHKSQGMTIPNLEISLRGVFEYGQAYVALSRGKSLKTLTLKGFDSNAFKAHPRVKAFYQILEEYAQNNNGDDDDIDTTTKTMNGTGGNDVVDSNTNKNLPINASSTSATTALPLCAEQAVVAATTTSADVLVDNDDNNNDDDDDSITDRFSTFYGNNINVNTQQQAKQGSMPQYKNPSFVATTTTSSSSSNTNASSMSSVVSGTSSSSIVAMSTHPSNPYMKKFKRS